MIIVWFIKKDQLIFAKFNCNDQSIVVILQLFYVYVKQNMGVILLPQKMSLNCSNGFYDIGV